jgi:hypothetical protein
MSGDLSAAAELVLHVVQCGDPRWHQVGGVAGPEELLASKEDVLVMFMPAYAGAGADGPV